MFILYQKRDWRQAGVICSLWYYYIISDKRDREIGVRRGWYVLYDIIILYQIRETERLASGGGDMFFMILLYYIRWVMERLASGGVIRSLWYYYVISDEWQRDWRQAGVICSLWYYYIISDKRDREIGVRRGWYVLYDIIILYQIREERLASGGGDMFFMILLYYIR